MPIIVPIQIALSFLRPRKEPLKSRSVMPGQIWDVTPISSVDHRGVYMAQSPCHPLRRFTSSKCPGCESMPGLVHPTEWQTTFPYGRYPNLPNCHLINWPPSGIQKNIRASDKSCDLFLNADHAHYPVSEKNHPGNYQSRYPWKDNTPQRHHLL